MCSDIQAKPPEQIYKEALPSVLTLMVEKKDGTHSQGSAFLAAEGGQRWPDDEQPFAQE